MAVLILPLLQILNFALVLYMPLLLYYTTLVLYSLGLVWQVITVEPALAFAELRLPTYVKFGNPTHCPHNGQL